MEIKPSTTNNKLDSKRKSLPISSSNIEHLETFIIVWLDSNINKNQLLQKLLRQYITCLVTFNDLKLCEQWIKTRLNNEKILFIVSGALGQRIIPNIHQLQSIIAIYVFCLHPEYHTIWTRNYSKIHGIISES
ncbi:unnamed protein product, partial [Adineta steineri]